MASVERANEPADAPTTENLLTGLREDVQADAAVLLRFGQHGRDIVISDVVIDGPADHWGLMRDGIGPPGFDHDDSDDALSMREGQWCLQAPAQRHFNKFCWFDDDIAQIAPWERSAAYRSLYEPNHFAEQYRAVLVDHGEVTGWVALFWTQPPRQRELLESKAENHLGELRRSLRQTHGRPAVPHRLLLDASGDVLARNSELPSVFDEGELRRLRRSCRPTHDKAETVRFFDGYSLRTVPMNGEDGDRATLVLVEPLEPVTVDMRKALTSLQRRVAELIADGHSNKQAAEVLDVSVNTVKYHLKNIYPIVGVTNRVELASFLSGSH